MDRVMVGVNSMPGVLRVGPDAYSLKTGISASDARVTSYPSEVTGNGTRCRSHACVA
jgi:hypothetical protein